MGPPGLFQRKKTMYVQLRRRESAVRSINKVLSSVVKEKMRKHVGGTDTEHPFLMLAIPDLGSVNASPPVLQILWES
jgi:hypothetical protein